MSSKGEMRTFTGLATARGFAIGPAFVYRGEGDLALPEYRVAEGREEDEIARLAAARAAARREIEHLIETLKARADGADVEIFEGHLMILEDPQLVSETERIIRKERLNALASTRRATDSARTLFEKMDDPYFRERVRDLNDVERRLLKALAGSVADEPVEMDVPSVVVADDLSPSETLRLPREKILGFAIRGGSPTSHAALLARAMGIPAVTGIGPELDSVEPGDTLIVNGTDGTLVVHPDAAAVGAFSELIERKKELAEEALLGKPAGSLKGGGEVLLFANVHPGVPFDGIREQGARGIGLYRSEYLWLSREGEPTEEEQFAAYREAAAFVKALGRRATLTVRTLDIGGDKLVRGVSETEANPFLGNRSIRYLLTHPDVFRTQLRAILRASAFGPVCIMHPMVSCVEEVLKAKAILGEVKRALDAEGVAYDRTVPVGIMIEVPAAALNADALARHVDFFSIGTNDLIQYAMAADRGNETVSHLYQPTNPAVMKLMRMTLAAAKRHGIPVGVCGESAADPIVGVLWAAMGVDMLSMSATYVPVISKLLSRLTRADLDEYAALAASLDEGLTAAEAFERLRAWMASKVFDLDTINI